MKAWVIKTKRGYITGSDINGHGTLIESYFYRTKQQAFDDASAADEVIPVEINLIKRKKK